MSTFYLTCMWIVSGTVIVEAESAQEAADMARTERLQPDVEEVIEDSYRVLDINVAQ